MSVSLHALLADAASVSSAGGRTEELLRRDQQVGNTLLYLRQLLLGLHRGEWSAAAVEVM